MNATEKNVITANDTQHTNTVKAPASLIHVTRERKEKRPDCLPNHVF